MRSTWARLGILIVAIAAAVALFVVLNEGDDEQTDGNGTTTSATGPRGPRLIEVRDGEPVGGVKALTYDKGDEVNIEVLLNAPEEAIHVHGHELEKPATKSPVRLSFPARLDGIFEIEVHRLDGSEGEIAELHVNP